MSELREVIGITVGVIAIIGALAAWWKWWRPKAHTADAVSVAILGREEVRDRSGAVIQHKQPGMVAQVMALTETVDKLADMHTRFNRVEADVAEIRAEVGTATDRLGVLEAAAVERVASKAESVSAFRAIEAVATNKPKEQEDQ